MTNLDAEIGRRIVAARESVGMTQRDLSRYAGLSQPTIHRIESGTRSATAIELITLADACGVQVSGLRGTNALREEALCAGRTNDDGTNALADYLLHAFGLAQRLDELGVAEVAA